LLPSSADIHVVYQELSKSLQVIDDFRARLLALLPLSSGAGIFLLLRTSDDGNGGNPEYLGAIGVIGALISLGLYFFELREMIVCSHLLNVGRRLECEMGFDRGQFRGRPPPSLSQLLVLTRLVQAGDAEQAREWRYILLPSVPLASCVVYVTVIAGWVYVAVVGFTS
jgi:hypothetical protein